MKALLKNGKWVGIDTEALFHDQYITIDGRRIFDKDIARIVADARVGLGKCKYCGATVRRGEEEKHFAEMEAKPCGACYWQRERVTDRESRTETQTLDGERVTVRTTVEKLEKVCSYAEKYPESKCSNCEHRRMGIDWFTPENTFFLRYPDGFASIPEIDKLEARGFVLDDRLLNAEYFKKLGSYTLTALLSYENGKPQGVTAYRIGNCRRWYVFRYENGDLFTDKYAFGWRQVKTLEGIPSAVMAAIKAICNH